MLRIKKSDRATSKRQQAMREVIKEDKEPLYAQVDKSLYWKLKNVLVKQQMTYTEWLSEKIEEE